ncbi:hypothetical protein GCM10009133_27280 [Cocleimonas flava]
MVTSNVGEGGDSGNCGGLKPIAYNPACNNKETGIVKSRGSLPKIFIEDISISNYYCIYFKQLAPRYETE